MWLYRFQKTWLITMLLASVCTAVFSQLPRLEWIDLTYPFSAETPYWPNNPRGFEMDTLFEGHTHGGYYYSSYSFYAPEHGGTHLDAPVHFAEGKMTVDQIALDQLMGQAIVIDVSAKALKNRDYLIQITDILDWEKKYGHVKEGAMILFRTGYGKFYPDRKTYFGTDKMGEEGIPLLHFPGLAPDAAQFLATKRKVKAVGIDTPSIDYGQSKDFFAHRILLGENIPVFENVAHLDQLPDTGIYLIALPMLIKDGSGGPLRIIAGLPRP